MSKDNSSTSSSISSSDDEMIVLERKTITKPKSLKSKALPTVKKSKKVPVKKSKAKTNNNFEPLHLGDVKLEVVEGVDLAPSFLKVLHKRGAYWFDKFESNKEKFAELFGESSGSKEDIEIQLLKFLEPNIFWDIMTKEVDEKYKMTPATKTIDVVATIKRKPLLIYDASISYIYAFLKFAPGVITILYDKSLKITSGDLDLMFENYTDQKYKAIIEGKTYFFDDLLFIEGYRKIKSLFNKEASYIPITNQDGKKVVIRRQF